MANTMKADLNLLLTLNILLEESSVSRAAVRLNLSQPSVSARLDRLRQWLGDPLLIPTSRGMRSTARAEALRRPLLQMCALMEVITYPAGPFLPTQARGIWRIAATDYGGQTVLTPLMRFLRESAPGMQIVMVDMKPALTLTQLEKGETDLVICQRAGAPEGLHMRALFHERYVLAGRIGHPVLKKGGLSMEQFCRLEHIVVSPEGGGLRRVTDTVLDVTGLRREVVLSVPHFMVMAGVLADTDLVAMIPEKLAAMMPELITVKAPLRIPGFEMVMLWHERQHRNPAHQWLRDQLFQHTTENQVKCGR